MPNPTMWLSANNQLTYALTNSSCKLGYDLAVYVLLSS